MPVQLTFTSEQIDAENGILKDVVMCQVGPAKGHGVHLEQEFINDLIDYDNENFTSTGLKARFGHPAMSDTTMGTQMGAFKNFRVEGEQALGDLHLLDAANLSPKYPSMKDWMLAMAEEKPDFVMSSIVFRPGSHYQRNKKGDKRYCWCYVEVEGEDGEKEERYQSPKKELGKIFVEFGENGQHFYTDLVEAGAATDALFSNQFNTDKFAVQIVDFVKDHPELHQFVKDNPSKLIEFSEQLGIVLPKPSFTIPEKFNSLKTFLGLGQSTSDYAGQIQQLQEQMQTASAEYETKKTAFEAEIERLKTELQGKDEEITELKERVPDPLKFEPGNKNKKEPKELHPFTQKAIKMYGKKSK